MNYAQSSWSEHEFFPMQNVWAAQQKSPKIVLTFDCGNGEQSTRFICIIHIEKHNGIILLKCEACTKQLVPPTYNLHQKTTVTVSTVL